MIAWLAQPSTIGQLFLDIPLGEKSKRLAANVNNRSIYGFFSPTTLFTSLVH